MPQQPVQELGDGENLRQWLDKLRLVANLAAALEHDDWIKVEEIPNGRMLSLEYERLLEVVRGDVGMFPFWVNSSNQDSTNKRWEYTCYKPVKVRRGHGTGSQRGWRIDTSDVDEFQVQKTYTAYSNMEDANNASATTYGNGVVKADITAAGGTYDLAAIPNTTVVYCKLQTVFIDWNTEDETTVQEWTVVNVANGVTGQC